MSLSTTPRAISSVASVSAKVVLPAPGVATARKSRGEAAYTLLDLDAGAAGWPDDAIERLAALEGVRRVRVVK